MGSVQGLALPLLFFCWKAGVSGSSPGPSTSRPAPSVITNNTEVPVMTHWARRSWVPGKLQTTGHAEYSARSHISLETQTQSTKAVSMNLIQISTVSEVDSKEKTTSTTAGTANTQTTYPSVATPKLQTTSVKLQEGQTASPTTQIPKLQSTSPVTEIPKLQSTSSATGTGKIQKTHPSAAILELQSTSPAVERPEIQTSSPAQETLEFQTPSSVTETTKTQTTHPIAGPLGTTNTFSSTSALQRQTTSPAAETGSLTALTPSNLKGAPTTPVETPATSVSLRTIGMGIAETSMGSDPTKIIFDTLCTDGSSQEAKRITIDLLTLAHSTEAERLNSDSSSSSDSTVGDHPSSGALGLDSETQAKDLVTYSITHIELTNCVTEIEASAIISWTSRTDQSPTRVIALSTIEASASPHSTEAKSHTPTISTSAQTLSTTSTSESTTLGTTLEAIFSTSGIIEKETTAAKTHSPSGVLVSVSRTSLEDTSALSTETQSHVEALGATTVSTVAGSTEGKVTSFAGSSAPANSSSETAITENSTPSETLTTDSKTDRSFPIIRSPLPFVHLTTENITLTKTTTSAKPPTSSSTSAWTRQITKTTSDGDGGFLLVRLSVASPEDLTEPNVAERLIQQLRCELHTHMLLVQVSLLRVRRG